MLESPPNLQLGCFPFDFLLQKSLIKSQRGFHRFPEAGRQLFFPLRKSWFIVKDEDQQPRCVRLDPPGSAFLEIKPIQPLSILIVEKIPQMDVPKYELISFVPVEDSVELQQPGADFSDQVLSLLQTNRIKEVDCRDPRDIPVEQPVVRLIDCQPFQYRQSGIQQQIPDLFFRPEAVRIADCLDDRIPHSDHFVFLAGQLLRRAAPIHAQVHSSATVPGRSRAEQNFQSDPPKLSDL